jgi:hypothetical protein
LKAFLKQSSIFHFFHKVSSHNSLATYRVPLYIRNYHIAYNFSY